MTFCNEIFKKNFEPGVNGSRPYQNHCSMLNLHFDPNSIPNQFAKLQGLERTKAINYLHGNPEILRSLINSLIYSLQGVGLPKSNLPTIAERIKKSIDETLDNLRNFLMSFIDIYPYPVDELRNFLALDTETQATTQS